MCSPAKPPPARGPSRRPRSSRPHRPVAHAPSPPPPSPAVACPWAASPPCRGLLDPPPAGLKRRPSRCLMTGDEARFSRFMALGRIPCRFCLGSPRRSGPAAPISIIAVQITQLLNKNTNYRFVFSFDLALITVCFYVSYQQYFLSIFPSFERYFLSFLLLA